MSIRTAASDAPFRMVSTGSDTELLNWLEKYDQCVFRLGHTWYAREGYMRPNHKCSDMRSAIKRAMELNGYRFRDPNEGPNPCCEIPFPTTPTTTESK